MPKSLSVTLANLVYFEKAQLPQALANRLIRLAAFQNPEFYKAQAMRMSVWDKPRVIGNAENYPQHIALPRGCLDAAVDLLRANGVACDLSDERFGGEPIDVSLVGTLRLDQEAAVAGMLHHDTGVLCAPTAFGKTVTAAAMIARRGVNTLVLVHRTELLKQWQERLQTFLGVSKGVIGTIGGGKAKPTGKIDIAVMQSLSRQGEVDPLVENYGQVIVDECHHVGAVSFDAILKRTKAKYVLGLTATPIRRDGQQPIIFMQCGPIRYTAAKPASAPHDLEVIPRSRFNRIEVPTDVGIQDVFRYLANDQGRTNAIAMEVKRPYEMGRKVLVLTERTDHLDGIKIALDGQVPAPFVLHGRMSKKQRAALIAELEALPPDVPRVLLATGKLVGEGFDHPPLDTLVLAMPVSWKGTLQQYAGRLHRAHASKTDVRIIDFVDAGHPALLRMWDKRQRGYRAMGYRVGVDDCTRDLDVRTDLQQPVLALIGLAKPPMPHASMPQAGMKGAMAGDMKQSMTAGMEQMQQMTMSGNTDKDFAMMMKIHHEGALDMAELQLANGKSPELKAMAKRTIAAQKMDIAEFDRWLAMHHGDAAALHEHDKGNPNGDSWGIGRESKSPTK
jgi:superfamily II DNA or RNA helicase